MPRKIPVKITIPSGPTVVWKKNRLGKIRPTIVRRRAYTTTVYRKPH